MRGDYGFWPLSSPLWPGHPHVRGDYGGGHGRPGGDDRAIPTCVGTTGIFDPIPPSGHGPSPRAWGLRGRSHGRRSVARAIPTCVGTTSSGPPPPPRWTGHPHVRGDYAPWMTASMTAAGHPHVRGDYPMSFLSSSWYSGPSPRAWGLRLASAGRAGGQTGHPHVRGDYPSPSCGWST